MYIKNKSVFSPKLLAILLVASLSLSACALIPDSPPKPTGTSPTIATPQTTATITPLPTVATSSESSLQFSLDTRSLATGIQAETIAAVSANDNAPYWEVLPEYTQLTLQDYPITNSSVQPRIFIYPLNELGTINEGAGKVITSLQTLLQAPQEIADMPFLPLTSDVQQMHTQLQYLDFKNGQGLRYLTEYGNGISPINNNQLFYTYQGITSDGQYYVAAILPVNHPSLPADPKITGNEPPEFASDYLAYRATVGKALNTQAQNTFTPDLTQIDAMLSSLKVIPSGAVATTTPEIFIPFNPSPTPSNSDLPMTCQVTDLSVYIDQPRGYCFAYPTRFTKGEASMLGVPAIIGPMVDNNPEAVAPTFAVVVTPYDPNLSFDQQVENFLKDFSVVAPDTLVHTTLTVGGEVAVRVEKVPVQLSWRIIFVSHNGQLYRLMYWPVDVSAAQPDLEELYQTTLNSFAFLP